MHTYWAVKPNIESVLSNTVAIYVQVTFGKWDVRLYPGKSALCICTEYLEEFYYFKNSLFSYL